jgi:hypothetical protein
LLTISWKKKAYVGVCMDAARVISENKGLKALIKRSSPQAVWTHLSIHRDSLATKELCPKLSEMMYAVIKTLNYIKTHPSESRLFAELCKKMGSQYRPLLFYCNSRWLSYRIVVFIIFYND